MKILNKFICIIALLLPVQSLLACEYPERVIIPNGTTATKEEMLEGQAHGVVVVQILTREWLRSTSMELNEYDAQ